VGLVLAPVILWLRGLQRRIRDLGRRLHAERVARKKAEAERDRLRRTERVARSNAQRTASERDRLRSEIRTLKRRLRAEQLVVAARQAPVTYLDETGWYVAMVRGKKAWLHVLSAPALGITLFAIRFSRGREVAEEILGDSYPGVSVVDGWAAYMHLPWRKGQCHAHLLRRCAELLEVQTRGAARFPLAVERLLLTGMEVKGLLPAMAEEDRAALGDQIRGEMRQLLEGQIEEPANLRFANHLRSHEEELFTYLDVEAVEPTNIEGYAARGISI